MRGPMEYVVVIENAGSNFSAYVPDLPGCVTTGRTKEEVRKLIYEAIVFHLEGLREDGIPIPEPQTPTRWLKSYKGSVLHRCAGSRR